VLFDLDGLLVDSEPLWSVAEREVAAELHGEFTPQIKAAMIGQALPVAVPILLQGLDTPAARVADPQEVGQRLLIRVAQLFAAELPLQPGAWRLLEEVSSAGVPIGLVSSSYRLLVDTALEVLGRDRFSVTVAGDEVENSKPAPDPYLLAAACLGLPPSRCVVLEDSLAGVRSATAAGCPCVFVPTFHPDDVPAGATLRRSLEEVDLAVLAAVAERSTAA
jgi:HAD superfamily hydrolase (TIGR01509 family)